MISPEDIDAVVFDMGGVFIIPAPEPISAIVRAAGLVIDIDEDATHRAHYEGIAAITSLLGGSSDHHGEPEANPDTWLAYDRAYFGAIGLRDDELAAAQAARERSRGGNVAKVWTQVLVENRSAFRRIAASLPVAIVSNNDGTAAEQCLAAELCQVGDGPYTPVEALVDSGVLGIAKPDPRIFSPALEALATAPERTLYVGDTVHADVHGAANAGMPVVQLDPYDLHVAHDHWRLPDVVALASHLDV